MAAQKRIVWLDAAKGFAILLVVAGHVFSGDLHAGMFPQQAAALDLICRVIYAFHMPLFFLPSGYVYQTAYFGGKHRHKARRLQTLNLAAVFLLFSVGFGLCKVLLRRYTNADVTLADVALVWLKPIPPYWYLYVLCICCMLFAPDYLRKKPYLTLGVCILLGQLGALFPARIGEYFALAQLLSHLPFFWLGVLLCEGKCDVLLRMPVLAAGALLSGLLTVLLRNTPGAYQRIPVCNLLIACGIAMPVFALFRRLAVREGRLLTRLFCLLGRHSLEIFLLHSVFTAGCRVLLPLLGITGCAAAILCNVLLSTAVSLGLAVFCQKMGIREMIFQPVKYSYRKRKQ